MSQVATCTGAYALMDWDMEQQPTGHGQGLPLSPPPSEYVLPLELLDYIIDIVAQFRDYRERKRALLSLALTSRRVRLASHRHVFGKLVFSPKQGRGSYASESRAFYRIRTLLPIIHSDPRAPLSKAGVPKGDTLLSLIRSVHLVIRHKDFASQPHLVSSFLALLFKEGTRPCSLHIALENIYETIEWHRVHPILQHSIRSALRKPLLKTFGVAGMKDLPVDLLHGSTVTGICVTSSKNTTSEPSSSQSQRARKVPAMQALETDFSGPILQLLDLTSFSNSTSSSAPTSTPPSTPTPTPLTTLFRSLTSLRVILRQSDVPAFREMLNATSVLSSLYISMLGYQPHSFPVSLAMPEREDTPLFSSDTTLTPLSLSTLNSLAHLTIECSARRRSSTHASALTFRSTFLDIGCILGLAMSSSTSRTNPTPSKKPTMTSTLNTQPVSSHPRPPPSLKHIHIHIHLPPSQRRHRSLPEVIKKDVMAGLTGTQFVDEFEGGLDEGVLAREELDGVLGVDCHDEGDEQGDDEDEEDEDEDDGEDVGDAYKEDDDDARRRDAVDDCDAYDASSPKSRLKPKARRYHRHVCPSPSPHDPHPNLQVDHGAPDFYHNPPNHSPPTRPPNRSSTPRPPGPLQVTLHTPLTMIASHEESAYERVASAWFRERCFARCVARRGGGGVEVGVRGVFQ